MPKFDLLGRVTREGWEAIGHEMGHDTSLPLIGRVLLKARDQYGAVAYHPANALARELCAIARTKTMTWPTIEAAKRMGLTVQTTGAEPRTL